MKQPSTFVRFQSFGNASEASVGSFSEDRVRILSLEKQLQELKGLQQELRGLIESLEAQKV